MPRSARRALHIRRELRYPLENGVGEFLPPEALKTSVEWQDGLLDRLNDQVRGMSCDRLSVAVPKLKPCKGPTAKTKVSYKQS